MSDLVRHLKQECGALGHARFQAPDLESLLSIANDFGRILKFPGRHSIIDELLPKDDCSGTTKTLSSVYGKGNFPLHTDCAYLPSPPRYLILWCRIPDILCGTTVLNWSTLDLPAWVLQGLETGLWFVRSGNQHFLRSVLRSGLVRWDIECMKAMDRTAKRSHWYLSRVLSEVVPTAVILDAPGEALILDNHCALHGRQSVRDQKRRFSRVYIG